MFESVAMDIFTKHAPKDVVANRMECPSCDTPINEWYITHTHHIHSSIVDHVSCIHAFLLHTQGHRLSKL